MIPRIKSLYMRDANMYKEKDIVQWIKMRSCAIINFVKFNYSSL